MLNLENHMIGMQQPMKVMVAALNQELIGSLEAFLSSQRETQLVGVVSRTREVLDRLDDWEPDILLLEEVTGGPVVEIARDVKLKRPKTAVFALVRGVDYGDPEYHRRLMTTHVSGVFQLTEPLSFQNWVQPMSEAVDLLSRIPDKESVQLGHIIVLHSLKGGVGKSVIAANLSACLTRQGLRADQAERRVLLVDLNLPFGGVDTIMNLTPTHSILDLLTVMDSLNRQNVQRATASHLRPGLRILAAPLPHEQIDYLRDILEEELFFSEYDGVTDDLLQQVQNARVEIGATPAEAMQREVMEHVLRKAKAKQAIVQLVRRLLTSAPRYFDYVVIDMPSTINEMGLFVLRQADRLLLLCTPDVPTIRALRTELNLLPDFGIMEDRIQLLLNRVRKGTEIKADEVKILFEGANWLAEIPEDPKLESLVNVSDLAVEAVQSIPFAVSIQRLTDVILSDRGTRTKEVALQESNYG